MSVIQKTDVTPETIDTRPLCECGGPDREPCPIHGSRPRPAVGRFKYTGPVIDWGPVWICQECLDDARRRPCLGKWERVS